MALVEVRPMLPDDGVIYDLRYETSNNFTGQVLYVPKFEPQLEEVAAYGLVRATESANLTRHKLVIFDLWRPKRVQPILRQFMADDRFVLDEDESKHPQGLAADVSLADMDGNYLDMGTDYDDFTELAYAKPSGLSSQQAFNRQLLVTIMTQAGFKQWPYEWWHFDFVDGEAFA